ncbi:hypothetical protein SNE40_017147 [Patella caerulea]|uniref:Uncharacterized protein n=1 Tax=Patella caerulea TaxID=87958 RepID=A0AAN8PF68_PATCE
MFIVISIGSGFLNFVQVDICLLFNEEPYFICRKYCSKRSGLGLYEISKENVSITLLHFKDILDPFPLSHFQLGNTRVMVISLKSYPYNSMVYDC